MKRFKTIAALAVTAAVTGSCGAYLAFADGGSDYYVCYSTENYAVRNSNKMREENGEYYLYDVKLSSLVSFYVTDNSGRRWYAADGKEMSVDETASYSYNLKFSPEAVYSDGTDGWEITNCNITYSFYTPAEYSVIIDGESFPLTYNPYHTSFDEYYISSLYLNGGSVVAYGEEEHTIADAGYYRILFTSGENSGGNYYAFDRNGAYGTGDGFEFNLYIEDAPQYFLRTEGSENYLPLTRYENNTSANEYRSEQLFISERDFNFKYAVYERGANGTYVLIDDDNDEDTAYSKIKVSDVGWYEFSFKDGGSVFSTSCEYQKRSFGGFYLAGEFNGYCYDAQGYVDADDKFLFTLLEEGGDGYEKDYDQYELFFTVSESSLKEGDVEFYITDGDSKYKNGTQYISISRAGEYRIIFSEEHVYGNARHYRYVLQDADAEYTEIKIGTVGQFIDFARACTASADYSRNKAVYLTADIDFSGVDFVSVGEFSGTFYGGYHTLKNITLDKDNSSVFNIIKRDGVVERLTVNLSLTDKQADYAGFAGRNYGLINGVNVYGSIVGNNYVGAVAAYNGRSAENETTGSTDTNSVYRNGIIKNCNNYAAVSGTVHTGGISGFNAGEIYECTNNAAVSYLKQSSSSTPFNLGGIAGYSAGKITVCTNNSAVVGGGEALYAGGICGLCTGEIYFSFNKAEVSGRRYAGGIYGYFGTLSNGSDRTDFFGGLTLEEIYDRYFTPDEGGFEQASGSNTIIKYCKNTGAVTSVSYAGGVGGYADAAGLIISCCISQADVSVTAGSYAGGICGYAINAQLDSCISGGRISAKGMNGGLYVGGIVGYGNGITACSSVCELKAAGYIGGIAGYNQSGIYACWANVIIIPESGAQHIGNIAGYTEALNEAADNFTVGFESNYYIENSASPCGGVDGRSYGSNYVYAACPIASEELAFNGALSPLLSEGFSSCGKWQGTDGAAYPAVRYLVEADECTQFNDDGLFLQLYNNLSNEFSASAVSNAQILYTVTFLEWNEDNGSLYDDGELQYDNFDVIYSVRLPLGEGVTAPGFVKAYYSDGRYIYDGGDASYFVSFPDGFTVSGHTVVYAVYREIARTVATADDKVLVEGLFDADTEVVLVQSVNGYSLEFYLDGERLEVGTVTVKFRPDADGSRAEVYGADGLKEGGSEASGSYITFKYSDGDYFTIVYGAGGSGLPVWAWALIGGVIGAAVVAAAGCVPFIVRKIKRKKP